MKKQTPFLILALNLNTEKEEREVLGQLKVPYTQCLGVYDGLEERSYLFPLTSSHGDESSDLIELARRYNQHSVLIVDANRIASLYYIESNTEHTVGFFQETTSTEGLTGWTKLNNKIYTVAR
jgi:hypothetical protein